MNKVHVGFLLSYDYEKLKKSIPPVYEHADVIYIAADIENRTWSGQKFEVDPSFFEWLQTFDRQNKIQIYKDDFYLPSLSAIGNDTRERTMLSQKMGVGNWLVQVDADEYFIDFKKFVHTLRKYDRFLKKPQECEIHIAGFLINMFKYTDQGLLYVNEPTKVLLATNFPSYTCARQTRKRIIYTDNLLLHECVARTEEELITKFSNWGHKTDFNMEEYLTKWRSVTKDNYREMTNFFYMEGDGWKELEYIDSKCLEEIKVKLNFQKKLHPSAWFLVRKNLGQYIKHLVR